MIPNIQLMIDFYHFLGGKKNKTPPNFKVQDHLRHLHMANPNGRVMPLEVG